jgi:hypothetical protein
MLRHDNTKDNYFYLEFCWTILLIVRYSVFFFGIALIVNLYKRAMAFEKEFIPDDPEKEQLNSNIEEILGAIEEINNANSDDSTLNDNKFENQKIVAWLLNRNKEAQQGDRQAFFNKINKDLKEECMQEQIRSSEV